VLSAGDIGLRSARRHGRADPGQHQGVRRGPRAPRGPGPACTWPCARRLTSACSSTSVAARARAERRGDVRERHHGQPEAIEDGDEPRRSRPTPSRCSRWPSRASSPPRTPAAEGLPGPAGDGPRADRGLGRATSVGQRGGRPSAGGAAAGRGVPAPARGGRPGRADLRAWSASSCGPRRLREAGALWAAVTDTAASPAATLCGGIRICCLRRRISPILRLSLSRLSSGTSVSWTISARVPKRGRRA
jgi:hypothetical protein